ncbi:hypothetical protein BDR06DRAFT_561935 [Suillus hirtellus]|nr:hypothetical protein BDR06DRAFT_561935 [Suillus hirtellus]
MEHDEAPPSHDPNSTNVQASAPASVPHQTAPSSSVPVEDDVMAISLAHHSGPSPGDPQNTATCSSADSYPSSSLKIPTSLCPELGSGARALLDQVYLPLILRSQIALFPQLRRAAPPMIHLPCNFLVSARIPIMSFRNVTAWIPPLSLPQGTLVVQPQNGRSTPSLIPLRGHVHRFNPRCRRHWIASHQNPIPFVL